MTANPKMKRAVDFFGLKRSILGIMGMAVLVGMGERMAERFLPVYVIALGAGAAIPGFLNGMDNLLGAFYSFPGGYLSDRLGAKKALLLFNLIAIFGFLIVILVPTWPAVFVGSIFFLSWTAISLPATMDIVSKALPKNKRTMGVTMHSLVRRIPMALGPIAGGWCIDKWGIEHGVRIAFGFAIVFAVVAGTLQQVLIEETEDAKARAARKSSLSGNPIKLFLEIPAPLRKLLVSDILIRFCEQIPYAYMAIWCMGTIAHPLSGKQFGVLTAVEMATAMLVYVPVAYFADKGNKKPFVVTTFIFFTAFPLMLLVSKSYLLLILAFIVRGLKEFGEPTRKALIMDLAPEGKKAATFGLYYLVRDTVVSVSAFASGLLWAISPATNLLTAFAFGVAGTLWFAILGSDKDIEKEQPTVSRGAR